MFVTQVAITALIVLTACMFGRAALVGVNITHNRHFEVHHITLVRWAIGLLVGTTLLVVVLIEGVVTRDTRPLTLLLWIHWGFDAAALVSLVLVYFFFNGRKKPVRHAPLASLTLAMITGVLTTGLVLLWQL